MIEFIVTRPENLSKTAKEWLSLACKSTEFCSSELDEFINDKSLSFVCVEKEDCLVGVFGMFSRKVRKELVLTIPILGGVKIKEWKQGLIDYIERICEQNSYTKVHFVGNIGWSKLFTEMKLVSCVYFGTPKYLNLTKETKEV